MFQFPFAKKSLGQNFLTSPKALSDIIEAAQVREDDEVLEIGPGRGVLTKELLARGAHVVAVEKDRVLVGILSEMFAKEIADGKLEIIEHDVLEFDLANFVTKIGKPYKLIANIPYYITGQIFRMFLESEYQPLSMTLLVQKEVADRVMARDEKESILSISVKAFGTPHYVSTVKRGSFNPAPNVDSAILHISDISKKPFVSNGINEKIFFEIVKAAFAHKRKIISKNLSDKNFVLPTAFDSKARAEDLKVENFIEITKANNLINNL